MAVFAIASFNFGETTELFGITSFKFPENTEVNVLSNVVKSRFNLTHLLAASAEKVIRK